MRAQLGAFERDLRTTHLYLASYVAHISPPLKNFPIIQTEHARASRLDDPRRERGHTFVRTRHSKGRLAYLTLSSNVPKSVSSAERIPLS
jgi:hypothetical protein